MNRKIIIIAGYLASGKSTFARRLSKELNVPCFVKDTFKSAICVGIEIAGREESRRFSAATFSAIAYVAERFMETGHPLILEGNFVLSASGKANEADVLAQLIEKYDYRSLTYIFQGDMHVLCDRFNAREKLPERGQANLMFAELSYEDFKKYITPLGDFTVGGKIVKIDTTNFESVDFARHIETARVFVREAFGC